ncbi:hypothetical protein VVR12_00245 [Rothia sp. LK2588]|uniref:hypothetical protein n=1 Tax=Rothia sp. LK2588 TaxID=3114369 RepID=UPI0034CDBE81
MKAKTVLASGVLVLSAGWGIPAQAQSAPSTTVAAHEIQVQPAGELTSEKPASLLTTEIPEAAVQVAAEGSEQSTTVASEHNNSGALAQGLATGLGLLALVAWTFQAMVRRFHENCDF